MAACFLGCAMHFAGGDPRQILGRVERGELDGALLPMPIAGDHWAVDPVASSPLVVCLRADDSLAQRIAIRPSDLAERLNIFRDPEAHPHAHARLREMLVEIGIEAQASHLAASPIDLQMDGQEPLWIGSHLPGISVGIGAYDQADCGSPLDRRYCVCSSP